MKRRAVCLGSICLSALIIATARQYVREHVRTDLRTGCWLATTSGDGRYKHFWFLGRRYKAHVLSWLAFRGPLRRTDVVDHEACNNTECCNPNHLNAVSQSRNIARAFECGRGKSPFLKQTELSHD